MKTKNCERFIGFREDCNDVQVGLDSTDHLIFICKECKRPLEVIQVVSKKFGKDTNCTWVSVVCHNCRTLGQRKFYWKFDGRFCHNKTKDGGDLVFGIDQ